MQLSPIAASTNNQSHVCQGQMTTLSFSLLTSSSSDALDMPRGNTCLELKSWWLQYTPLHIRPMNRTSRTNTVDCHCHTQIQSKLRWLELCAAQAQQQLQQQKSPQTMSCLQRWYVPSWRVTSCGHILAKNAILWLRNQSWVQWSAGRSPLLAILALTLDATGPQLNYIQCVDDTQHVLQKFHQIQHRFLWLFIAIIDLHRCSSPSSSTPPPLHSFAP